MINNRSQQKQDQTSILEKREGGGRGRELEKREGPGGSDYITSLFMATAPRRGRK